MGSKKMKTAVIMKRELIGGEIRQNHKTGMMNANDLHKIGNVLRDGDGLTEKQMASFFNLDSTKEFISEICIVENLDEKDVKQAKRGIQGGTWVHPLLFVEMAMWYSPKLKVKILKWVIDGLLVARDESGDSYKRMNGTLNRVFSHEFTPLKIAEIANTIASECKVGLGPEKWQRASEAQLKKREKIQDTITMIADLCPNIGTAVHKAINKVNAEYMK